MIFSQLTGGLGNQLFQYAAAKSLSIRNGIPLKLDLTYFKLLNKKADIFDLNINDEVATQQELDQFYKQPFVSKIIDRVKPYYKRRIFREHRFSYDSNFWEARNTVLLKGVWQTDKYFDSIGPLIRESFKVKNLAYPNLSNTISHTNSVGIHIRRGDYLEPVALKVLGLMPVDYYEKACQIIKAKTHNPVFYYFSNDPGWVKKVLLPIINGYVIEDGFDNALMDFTLMSLCKHNIIANSSFSWWAAWLNKNPDKIVIAPKKWFNKGPKDTQDLYPPGWLQI